MDFTRFAALPLIDGHIHFTHPQLLDDVLAVMETVGLARANLVGLPDLQHINQNPALIRCKSLHPQRFTICGALDYTQVLADPARVPERVGHWLGMDAAGFYGIALPREVLDKIYHVNFLRVFGAAPVPLNREAALTELERMAGVLDTQAGAPVESPARRVARELGEQLQRQRDVTC